MDLRRVRQQRSRGYGLWSLTRHRGVPAGTHLFTPKRSASLRMALPRNSTCVTTIVDGEICPGIGLARLGRASSPPAAPLRRYTLRDLVTGSAREALYVKLEDGGVEDAIFHAAPASTKLFTHYGFNMCARVTAASSWPP